MDYLCPIGSVVFWKKFYAPIINELVNTDSTAITGYGIPGAQMTLKTGTQILSEVLVNEWGQYKYNGIVHKEAFANPKRRFLV